MVPSPPEKVSSGVAGLDAILQGGLPAHEIYLFGGKPGTGKTTFGLQFLLEGVKTGQRVLYLSLSQTERALRKIADSHGWSMEGVHIHESSFPGRTDQIAKQQTIFRSADVELGEISAELFNAIERIQPERLVFDSLAQIRLLANDKLQFQKQLFALRQYFADKHCTVLLLDVVTSEEDTKDVQDLMHGFIQMQRSSPEYGNAGRRLLIEKMRGINFHGGYHNFRIRTGGVDVFPRLPVKTARVGTARRPVASGVEKLDYQLGGGLDWSTSTLILGATGTGKTSLATLYAHAVAKRGDPVAIFLFEERLETFYERAAGLGTDLRPFEKKGLVSVRQINAGHLSPSEFSDTVRHAVVEEGVRTVVIDSLTGYFHTMPQEQLLATQMHELLSFLSQQGVLTVLTAGQHGISGEGIEGPVDVSYLCDTIVLLRHFDVGGVMRKAIAIVKRRHGPHEHLIRELRIDARGIHVGEPLTDFEGILSGQPIFHEHGELLFTANRSGGTDD